MSLATGAVVATRRAAGPPRWSGLRTNECVVDADDVLAEPCVSRSAAFGYGLGAMDRVLSGSAAPPEVTHMGLRIFGCGIHHGPLFVELFCWFNVSLVDGAVSG